MTFSPNQIASLEAPLSRSAVKSRSQAGRSLSYIEGWHAIAEANRIFGFDAWDRETTELRQLGDPREVDGKWRVAYMAKVRITVRPVNQTAPEWWVRRDGTGYGSGIDRDLGSAHESAIKEAETDAMKRALMTFGNPFGLALYDKDQANVVDDRQQARPTTSVVPPRTTTAKPEDIAAAMEEALTATLSVAELEKVATDFDAQFQRLPRNLQAQLEKVFQFKEQALKAFGEAAE